MKRIWILFLVLGVMFIGVKSVNAQMTYDPQRDCVKTSDGKYWNCTVNLYVTESPVNLNKFDVKFIMTNVTMGTPKNINSNFKIDSQSKTTTEGHVVVLYNDKTLPVGTHHLFDIQFTVNNLAQDCRVDLGVTADKIVRSCYYDSTFKLYYDGSGNKSTTKTTTYKIDCEKPTCSFGKGSDGVTYYFDGSGNKSTTKTTQYKIDCEPPKCEYLGGKYFNNERQQVTQVEFERECEKKVCEPSENGTDYFDPQGNIVTKEVYEDLCFEKPKCEPKDGKYYDNDSNEITKEQYNKVCLKYSCKKEDGKFYNKAGDVVTEENYELECGEKECRIIGNHYFDDKGKEVNKEQYDKVCVLTPTCGTKDGKYYDNNGNEATKAQYEQACFSKDNPVTGSFLPIITLISFTLIGAGLILITRNSRLLNRL